MVYRLIFYIIFVVGSPYPAQVQLRNSRAALAADRRVWLLERRDREFAALSKAPPPVHGQPPAVASSIPRQTTHHSVRGGGGGGNGGVGSAGGGGSRDSWQSIANGRTSPGDSGEDGGWGNRVVARGGRPPPPAVAVESPLLEGLRPECEAVMRALFCRVDR